MSRAVYLVALCVFPSVIATAQSDSSASGPSWFLTIQSGTLFGKKASTNLPGSGFDIGSGASVIQGIVYNRFRLGAGVGYDAYAEWRMLPIFAGTSYDLMKRRNHSFYIQANTGYSRAWSKPMDEAQPDYSEAGGFFHHSFIGYKVQQGKVELHFTAGYKFQRLIYSPAANSWIWGYPGYQTTTVQRDMGRMSVQMGIGF